MNIGHLKTFLIKTFYLVNNTNQCVIKSVLFGRVIIISFQIGN